MSKQIATKKGASKEIGVIGAVKTTDYLNMLLMLSKHNKLDDFAELVHASGAEYMLVEAGLHKLVTDGIKGDKELGMCWCDVDIDVEVHVHVDK